MLSPPPQPFIPPNIEPAPNFGPPLCVQQPVVFTSIKELPAGSLDVVGLRMADKDEPYQSTDAGTMENLPKAQFISAYQSSCELYITYRQGGRVSSQKTVTLRRLIPIDRWFLAPYPPNS